MLEEILTRKLVCAGGGAVPSQWTELPLRYQAIKSKNDKKKTIKRKKKNETKSWDFEKIKSTNSRQSE